VSVCERSVTKSDIRNTATRHSVPENGIMNMALHIHSVENRRLRIDPVANCAVPLAESVYLFLNQGYTVAANWRRLGATETARFCCWSIACLPFGGVFSPAQRSNA